MADINNLFFELIRVAIGNQVCLSHTPSADEWGALYAMAKKQSIVGICFAGLQKLYNFDNQEPNSNNPQPDSTHNQEPITKNLDEVQYPKWMGMAAKIQQRNEVLNARQPDVLRYFRDNGFHCSVLKGQGVGTLYRVYDNDGFYKLTTGDENENLCLLRQSGVHPAALLQTFLRTWHRVEAVAGLLLCAESLSPSLP